MSEKRPENQLINVRRQKRDNLKELGINPYDNTFKPTHRIAGLLNKDEGPDEYAIAGRVVALRSFGKAAFFRLRDRSGEIQAYIRRDVVTPDVFKVFKKVDVGDFVGIKGPLFRTKTGELTVEVQTFHFLTKSLRPLPEKWHGLKDVETRHRKRYLDLIMNKETREVFKTRTKILKYIRAFLDERDFLEVETPMMHPLISGANARPFITHHNALNIDLYLRIAPELYLKRLVVGGLERVYELNRNFRNEGISRKHNPEFTMVEFYMAYATYEDLIKLTEEMFSGLVKELYNTTILKVFDKELDFTPPFERMTFEEAIKKRLGTPDEAFHSLSSAVTTALSEEISPQDIALELLKARPDLDLGEKVAPDKLIETAKELEQNYTKLENRTHALGVMSLLFEEYVEETLINPTFITMYPVWTSPLARRDDKDPALVQRFELFINGDEIANAFSELNDPDDQEERFRQQVRAKSGGDEEAMDYDADYIEALQYGMPPTAGEGIGIDRLTMLLTGQSNIREVILFPLLKPQD